jgi:phosphoglycolate phosphatase
MKHKAYPVKAILFDKDGTLIEFNDTWHALYLKLAMEVSGHVRSTAEALLMRGGYDALTHCFAEGSQLAAGTTPGIVRLWLPDASEVEFVHWCKRLNNAFIEEGPLAAVPVKGLVETLTCLHAKGIKLAVVTNDLAEAAERTMQRLSINHLFSAILGYDSVPNPKPAADPVLKFCRDHNCHPSEVLVAGDNHHDIEMARNAGAGYAIGVLTGTGSRETLARNADAILNSIADLPEWLDNFPV